MYRIDKQSLRQVKPENENVIYMMLAIFEGHKANVIEPDDLVIAELGDHYQIIRNGKLIVPLLNEMQNEGLIRLTMHYRSTIESQLKKLRTVSIACENELRIDFPDIEGMAACRTTSLSNNEINSANPEYVQNPPSYLKYIAVYDEVSKFKSCVRKALSRLLHIPLNRQARARHFVIDPSTQVIERAKAEGWNAIVYDENFLGVLRGIREQLKAGNHPPQPLNGSNSNGIMQQKQEFRGQPLYIENKDGKTYNPFKAVISNTYTSIQWLENRDTKELCLAKCSIQSIGIREDDSSLYTPPNPIEEIKELLVLRLYAHFGVQTPQNWLSKVQVSKLCVQQEEYGVSLDEPKIHLMVQQQKDFAKFGQGFCEKYRTAVAKSKRYEIGGKELIGLGQLLAVAVFLQDHNCLGDEGDNAGFTAAKQAVKVEGVFALPLADEPEIQNEIIDQQGVIKLANTGEEIGINFNQLSPQDQIEFSKGLKVIHQTNEDDLRMVLNEIQHLLKMPDINPAIKDPNAIKVVPELSLENRVLWLKERVLERKRNLLSLFSKKLLVQIQEHWK